MYFFLFSMLIQNTYTILISSQIKDKDKYNVLVRIFLFRFKVISGHFKVEWPEFHVYWPPSINIKADP